MHGFFQKKNIQAKEIKVLFLDRVMQKNEPNREIKRIGNEERIPEIFWLPVTGEPKCFCIWMKTHLKEYSCLYLNALA